MPCEDLHAVLRLDLHARRVQQIRLFLLPLGSALATFVDIENRLGLAGGGRLSGFQMRTV